MGRTQGQEQETQRPTQPVKVTSRPQGLRATCKVQGFFPAVLPLVPRHRHRQAMSLQQGGDLGAGSCLALREHNAQPGPTPPSPPPGPGHRASEDTY